MLRDCDAKYCLLCVSCVDRRPLEGADAPNKGCGVLAVAAGLDARLLCRNGGGACTACNADD